MKTATRPSRTGRRKRKPSPNFVEKRVALEVLESGLVQALAQIRESERKAVRTALDAVLEFIISVPGWEKRNLGSPIWQLLGALADLDHGRVVAMLAPNPAVRNRKSDATMRKVIKAYALICLDVLCRAGWSVADGSRIIAQELEQRRFPLRGRIGTPAWKIVKGWRDGMTKLPKNDQARETFEGLKEQLPDLKLSRSAARRFAVGQLRELITKFGRSGLE